ncbi:MAG: MFS transporter [Sphingomonas sp.]|nr:MFS transporter [Sphingomonas sp.]
MTPAARRVSRLTRWSFGFGSIAYGVKDGGFTTFLLLYYNQVMGLPPGRLGLVIAAALLVEAFVDPFVGFLSDITRTPWGRRHPWMYASALPVALGWLLLWNPPAGWSQDALLAYVFGSALLVRIALSAFEIPSAAMGPELSSDYDERTLLFSYRYLFAWAGGLGMLFLAYAVFLVPDATHADGLQNPLGYQRYALTGAVIMALSILLSSMGLHPEIKSLPKPAPTPPGEHWREFRAAILNRGFLVLIAAGTFGYTAQGVAFTMSNYIYAFVWQFDTATRSMVPGALLIGAIFAFILAPRLSRGGDKPRIAAILTIMSVLLTVAPFVLDLLGWFPPKGSPFQVPLLFTIYIADITCGVAATILGSAMLADVVEDSEIRTGRRSEGVFFAGGFFVQKVAGALGIGVAGQILELAAFPAKAEVGQVSAMTIDRLMIYYIIAALALRFATAFWYTRFPFGRAEHEARLARLGAKPAE